MEEAVALISRRNQLGLLSLVFAAYSNDEEIRMQWIAQIVANTEQHFQQSGSYVKEEKGLIIWYSVESLVARH